MLAGKLDFLRRRRPELEADITITEVPDEHVGIEDLLAAVGGQPITNDALIEKLQADLNEAFRLLAWQGQTIAAARAFVELVGSTYKKTGEPVFKTTQPEDSLLAETLNHRFSDLAALLNQGTRPVPPKLAQGTVH
jgi:hypothetical protein